MKIPTEWIDRIEVQQGKIVRVLKAIWYDHAIDVYRENEDGEAQKRNLYTNIYRGYCVAFPGLPMYSYSRKSDPPAYEENWENLPKPKDFGGGKLTEYDKAEVCRIHPSFQYVFKKYEITKRWQLMEILVMWKKHPELELILAAGYENVGMSNYFWSLKEEKRKEICRFMRQFPQYKTLKTKEILKCLKSNNPGLYAQYIQTVLSNYRYGYDSISFRDFIYLSKLKGIAKDCFYSEIERKVSIYADVLSMLKNSHHDINDEYWRHPKDLIAIHAKLVEERDKAREARELAAIKEHAKKLEKVKKKFSEFERLVDGYSIFVSTDYAEWKKQANALHQCIVSAGYYQCMADGNYTIVFIQKDGIPQATAQIFPDGHLGQFYADEHSGTPGGSLPSEEIKRAFQKWFVSVPKSKFRTRKKRAKAAA